MRRTTVAVGLVSALLVLWAARIALAQPQGQITSPRDRATVRGLVPIEGSATHAQFQKYEIHFGPEPNPGDQWTPLGGSPFTVPVVQGRLAMWDTTVIPDGIYSIRLRLVRLDGNYDEYSVRGIQVVNTRPTETPTPKATSTPAAATNTPAPTSTVLIAVPTIASPTPRPTETPVPTAPPTATVEPAELPFGLKGVSNAACWGGGLTLAVFVAVGLFFALKSSLVSLFQRAIKRGRESLGIFED